MLRTTSKSEMSKSKAQRKMNRSNRYSVVEEVKKDPLLDYVRPKKKCFIDFGLQQPRSTDQFLNKVHENRFTGNDFYQSESNLKKNLGFSSEPPACQKHMRQVNFSQMLKRVELFGVGDSPYVVNEDDQRALSQLIGVKQVECDPVKEKEKRYRNLFTNPNMQIKKFYKNDLVIDKAHGTRPNVHGNHKMERQILRNGTILKHKGFIITSLGRVLDASLLDENDPLRKKLEKQQQHRKNIAELENHQPPLNVAEAIKHSSCGFSKEYIALNFDRHMGRDKFEERDAKGDIPKEMRLDKLKQIPSFIQFNAQKNSMDMITHKSMRVNSYVKGDRNNGGDLIEDIYYSSFAGNL